MTGALHHLDRLFLCLGRMSLEASVVIVLILGIQAALGKRLAPRWRYALWSVLILRLAIPWTPACSLSIYNLLASNRARPTPGIEAAAPGPRSPLPVAVNTGGRKAATERVRAPATGGEPDDAGPHRSAAGTSPLPGAGPSAAGLICRSFALLWAAGVLVFGGCAAVQSLLLASRIRRANPVRDRRLLELLRECKETMGVRTAVEILETELVQSPAVCGFLRPRLLLPLDALKVLGLERLRHVFLHELAHVKRHDVAGNAVMTVLQALHWMNPLVAYALYRLRADRELVCDALALSRLRPEASQEYGQTIVYLLEVAGCPWRPGSSKTLDTSKGESP